MLKSCFLGRHWWSKRAKQWSGKNGTILSKRCRHCGTLKEEGKYIEKIKALINRTKDLYNGRYKKW